MCVETCAKIICYTVLPYPLAADHIGDVSNEWSSRRGRALTKAFCMAVGGFIGAAVTIGLSKQMFDSFYETNKTVDNKRCTTSCQTERGLKTGAGICVAMVDFWALTFGIAVGGEIGDGIVGGANWLARGAQKVANCTKGCLECIGKSIRNGSSKPKPPEVEAAAENGSV